jgi:hypothetical protein
VVSSRRQPTTRPRPPAIGWTRPIPALPRLPKLPAGGAPAAPAAPAAPQYSLSNLPPDASYDAALAALARQRDQQLAAATQARTSTLQDYGFNEGAGGALNFDPNNPFSKAALLKKTYDQNRASTRQSLSAGGQMYSGAFQNAQDLVNRNELQSSDALQKALTRFLAQNTQQRAEIGTGFETAAQQAFGDRIGRFQSNPLYMPAASDPGSAPAAAGAAGMTKAQAAAGRPQKTVGGRRFYQRASDKKWIPL